MSTKVEKAAITAEDGKVFSVDRPGRHNHVIALMVEKGYSKPIKGNQGFLLDDGTFVERIQAKEIAIQANQLLPRASRLKELFSEDVW